MNTRETCTVIHYTAEKEINRLIGWAMIFNGGMCGVAAAPIARPWDHYVIGRSHTFDGMTFAPRWCSVELPDGNGFAVPCKYPGRPGWGDTN